MDNKTIQRNRMITYFVEATHKIIEEKGIKGVTIRNVANLAGYNSATLYNYFKDLDHLIYFASIKYLRHYSLGLSKIEFSCEDSKEKFIAIWKFFCENSFEKPNIFYNIFFNKYSYELDGTIKKYYNIFSSDFGEHSIDVSKMLKGDTLLIRNMHILKPLVNDNYVLENEINTINEIIVFTYQSLLTRKVMNLVDDDSETLTKKMVDYIKFILK